MQIKFEVETGLAIKAQNGGLFVARSENWIHPARTLESFELIFVKQGVLRLHEEDEQFEVQPGEALILWPHRRHGGIMPSPRNLKFYWVHFTLNTQRLSASADTLQVRQHVNIARPDQMTSLFRQLLNDQELFGAKSATLGPIVMLILCEAARSGVAAGDEARTTSSLAAGAQIVIQTKFSSPITASSIAAELRCNPDYLGRVFRGVYNKTITEALHECRTRHAAALLAESGTGVDEIARLSGFADPAYFRRIFKRLQGMTPGAWRALHTRTHINHS